MALKPATKCQTLNLTDQPTDLDLTNDGKLLAISIRSGKGSLVKVVNTKDGSLEGEYAADAKFAWGVAFVDGGKSLVYVVRDDAHHHHSLCRVKVGGKKPEVIGGWTQSELRVASISRNRKGSLYALNGSRVEVRSTDDDKVVQKLKNEDRDENSVSCFDAKGDKIWTYGTEVKSLIEFDVATGKQLRNLEGPRPSGQQVILSPNDRYLVAMGVQCRGITIYDLSGKKEKRILQDEGGAMQWNDDWGGFAFAFSHDSSLAAFVAMKFAGFRTSNWERIDYRPMFVEPGAHIYYAASALEAPMMAFGGLKSKSVIWFPLVK